MSRQRKIMWVEGMFMLPQHFQQHDRYFENLIHRRCRAIRPYGYGFYRVAIDRELLQIGKLAIAECQGVFPDGTPFNMPDDDPLPLPLDIPSEIHHEYVFLGLPLRQAGVPENDTEEHPEALARFRVAESETKDCNCGSDRPAVIQIGNLKSCLLS
ncbi:MAG: type VI secretion system baseplate subunit TssK, partial [Deltaproteobacteria bacterium]|nr:type VI secretion system baseplate subunit TssK [Candidatus Tharpella sp.]